MAETDDALHRIPDQSVYGFESPFLMPQPLQTSSLTAHSHFHTGSVAKKLVLIITIMVRKPTRPPSILKYRRRSRSPKVPLPDTNIPTRLNQLFQAPSVTKRKPHWNKVKRNLKAPVSSTPAHSRRFLPIDFVPGNKDVVCGKSSTAYHGKHRFDAILKKFFLPSYLQAPSDQYRATIIAEIVRVISNESPSGGFISKESDTGLCGTK